MTMSRESVQKIGRKRVVRKRGMKRVTADKLIGKGRKLWRSDKEFEDFVEGVKASRKSCA
jgi:hypothetical protein